MRVRRLLRFVLAGSLVAGVACTDEVGEAAPAADAEARTVVLAIEGMHCEACVNAIEGALKKVEGVESAKVSLEQERVTIQARGVDDATLEKTIDKLGYDAHPLEDAADEKPAS